MSFAVSGLGTVPIQVLAYKDANGLVILHLDLSAVPLGTLTTGIARASVIQSQQRPRTHGEV